jgi:hypothetical protein
MIRVRLDRSRGLDKVRGLEGEMRMKKSERSSALLVRNRSAFLLFACTAILLAVALSGCSKTSTEPSTQAVASPTPTAPHLQTYTTTFPDKEQTLSQGGRWLGGQTPGVDWGFISTTPGYAWGTAGPKHFADSEALLKGAWGPNQTVEAVVRKVAVHDWPEVSLRLRSSISENKSTGYEISDSLRDSHPYLIIVRWNGPVADFKYLVQVGGEQYRVTTGDVMKATIVGNLITAYKNGVEIGHATDDTFANGLPGFGFNEGKNGDYGITRLSVAATDAPGVAAQLPPPAAAGQ